MPGTATPTDTVPETDGTHKVMPDSPYEPADDVLSKLAGLGNDDDPVEDVAEETADEVEPEGSDEADTDVDDDDPADDDAGDDTAENDEPDARAAADDADEPSDAPTLSDAQRRSLHAYGWTDDDIKEEIAHSGDRFMRTVDRLHAKRNEEVAQWAEAGRQARSQDDPPAEPDTPADPMPVQAGALTPIDAAKIKETYGDDDLVDAVVAPVNAAINKINVILPQVQAAQQAVQQAEVDHVSRQVDGFFASDALVPFAGLYGSAKAGLTKPHVDKRNEVLDTAFDLITGARSVRGVTMSINEGLELAHQLVSKDFKTQQATAEVKKVAKKRAKGISMKPTAHGKQQAYSGPPKDEVELERRTRQRLAVLSPK